MRFMMMIKTPKDMDASTPPSPEMMAAVDKMIAEGMANGTIVGVGGLFPLATGTQVRVAGGKLAVIDGPFAEAKEVIGGYCIAEVGSKDQAVQMATDFMQMHIDILGDAWNGVCEVRQMADDAPDGKN
jgi:hypothetical protein